MTERKKVRFLSGEHECAAWHYPGTNNACLIMAGGTAVTKEPGTDLFAARFQDAGFHVLAFDHRRFGESGGRPRQVVRIGEQLADWRAAIAFAATLEGVDADRLAAWGFSLAGGHMFPVAEQNPRLAAAVAQTPLADGLAAARAAARHQRPMAMLRFTVRGLLDAAGALIGRSPLLVPLDGEPGTVALLTTPDSRDGDRALNSGNRHRDWQQAVAARAGLRITMYRPGRRASRVACPILVVACEQDQSVLFETGARAAERAPRGELVRLPGGHYAPFLAAHEQAVDAEVAFLRRHLLDQPLDRSLSRSGRRS
ncbi:alpha/beta hydrolase [Actinoallomurus iriomotensis]|uniref:Alpha/beta hydrolase n=1 Tax=Actinoallomurus iriomotensis TaxID=478107 RepID=A0A9W6S7J6_9ACTN|nr:alpha/beta fold hydrolase [Actinoallomurus iriomotensis]GLY88548.1 alpha/beta hydrolase [Actinoallomurus iriomotensis]